jgi:hypothetical protein|nr:DUF4337 family protein [Kofleriaceae bacterium]
MSEVTEMLEHAEHAGHGGHDGGGHGKGIAKYVGITMAVLGVLLALASAFVGGTRTDLISTMVKQTNVAMRYQATATKFRMLQANLLQLNALLPGDAAAFGKLEGDLHAAEGALTTPEAQNTAKVVRSFHDQLFMTVVPTSSDLHAFVTLARSYKEEAKAAQQWQESYDEAIEAYEEAGEHYEWGMLAAEIGIVIASIALLLSSKPAWLVAIALGGVCIVSLVVTNIQTRGTLRKTNDEIAESAKNYSEKAAEDKAEKADEELFDGAPKAAEAVEKGLAAANGGAQK